MTGHLQSRAMASPSPVTAWVLAARPKTLWAGAVPVVVATALAAASDAAPILPAFAAFIGSLLIQIGTNFVNDFADFKKGADGPDRLGPARVSAQGWLRPDQVLIGAAVALGLAALVGIYIIVIGGWPLALLGVLSLICAVAYTAGPVPLAYVGLGDVFVLLFFGGGAVCGTYYLLCHTVTPAAMTAALALGALATAILVVNNLRDWVSDARVNKRTLVVRFGPRFARFEYSALIAAAYVSVASAIAFNWAPRGWALCTLTLPLALIQIRAIWTTDGADLNPHLGRTAALELVFGLTLAAGAFL